jgi:hypothetical protein
MANLRIELEVSYVAMEDRSQVRRRPGRPPDLFRGGARADLAVFDLERRPIYAIEIKRAWDWYSAWQDGLRLCTLLDRCGRGRGGSVRAGFFGLFNHRSSHARHAPNLLEVRCHKIIEELEAWDSSIGYTAGPWKSERSKDGERAFQALCFSFSDQGRV